MHYRVWRLLRHNFDSQESANRHKDIRERLTEIWSNDGTAVEELIAAAVQAREAQEDEAEMAQLNDDCASCLHEELLSEGVPENEIRNLMSDDEMVEELVSDVCGAFFCELPDQLLEALRVVPDVTLKALLRDLGSETCSNEWRCKLILLAVELQMSNDVIGEVIRELTNRADLEDRFAIRYAAAWALGKSQSSSPQVVDALIAVADDRSESQPMRSYCIEALMDLGLAAAKAVPVLRRIHHDKSEGEDLNQFAWAALKSITADDIEHPCGGTVAEHMRNLYRAEMDES